jgi:hypothetical protein
MLNGVCYEICPNGYMLSLYIVTIIDYTIYLNYNNTNNSNNML